MYSEERARDRWLLGLRGLVGKCYAWTEFPLPLGPATQPNGRMLLEPSDPNRRVPAYYGMSLAPCCCHLRCGSCLR
jgi:hypothetical protein